MKILFIATALTIFSSGIAAAQDIGKGATLFKQCAACHKIGPGATNGVGPELNGLDGATPVACQVTAIPMPIRILASYGTKRLSSNTSRIRKEKFRVPKWYLPASRTSKQLRICGRTSSSSMPRAIRSKSHYVVSIACAFVPRDIAIAIFRG